MLLKKIIGLVGLILGVTIAHAQDTTLRSQQIAEQTSPIVNLRADFFNSPALRPYYRLHNYSVLAVDYEASESDLYLRQKGNGVSSVNFHSESFIKKSDNLSLWGKAYYTNDKVNNVSFNETLDYELVYPYVIADTIGGNLNAETYYFSGGLAKKLGNLTYGLNASFKGIQSYRNIDPRPLNISSDINLSLAVSKVLTSHYAVSLAISGQKYNQNNTLEFANALGFPLVFHAAGLGMYNELLAGKRLSAYYKGEGVNTQLSLVPVHGSGVAVQLGYNRLNLNKQLSSIVDPVSEIKHDTFNLLLGYLVEHEKSDYFFQLKGSYSNRHGIEAKFGNLDAGASMVKISEDLRYGNEIASVGLATVYHRKTALVNLFFGIETALADDKEYYISPDRSVEFQNFKVAASFTGNTAYKRSIINLDIKLTQLSVLNSKYSWPDQSSNTGIFSMLGDNYQYVSSNALTLSGSLRLDYPISDKLNLFLKGLTNYTSYRNQLNANQFLISAGFLF